MTSLLRLPGCCTYSKSKCALILTAAEMQITQEPAFVQQQHHCSRLRELQCYRHHSCLLCIFYWQYPHNADWLSCLCACVLTEMFLSCRCQTPCIFSLILTLFAWIDTGDSAADLSHISFQIKMGFFFVFFTVVGIRWRWDYLTDIKHCGV